MTYRVSDHCSNHWIIGRSNTCKDLRISSKTCFELSRSPLPTPAFQTSKVPSPIQLLCRSKGAHFPSSNQDAHLRMGTAYAAALQDLPPHQPEEIEAGLTPRLFR
jgi:hypothetical protein